MRPALLVGLFVLAAVPLDGLQTDEIASLRAAQVDGRWLRIARHVSPIPQGN